ncbi:unnamed protein product [Ilex paraguariensis]|uniref:Subtilisin-like protease SBT1.4 n=1 Tax=Ilex paraguariensis TaxID=185542 RepID=A0ABC8RZM3_9AQUA
MAVASPISSFVFVIFSFFLIPATLSIASESPETFIVHVSRSDKPTIFTTHHHWFSSIIASLPPSHHPSKLLYTYHRSIHGFSASLTAAQATELRRISGVLSVIPDRVRFIHTTRTPHFLGLADSFGLWPNSNYADDVIIGVLDTGIWPERPCFADTGISPVPSTWKGICETGPDFPESSCNRKIIGARAYHRGYEAGLGKPMEEIKSPRDIEGHGTHTASTAAGSVVANASFYQYAKGEARGMAIKARIAAYKICWRSGCYDSDILAAMDQAITDGVHVISLSVGATGHAPEYDHDSIAIGAFRAAEHGVLVSCSAGNSGPDPYTVVNIAPWILTVGASTIDREFPADVILGDGRIFGGVSLYSGDPLGETKLPLVNAEDCGSKYCYSGKLNSSKIAGKIVLCDRGGNGRVAKGSVVKLAGGAGMILANLADSGEELIADSHLVPASMVGQTAGDKIRDYIGSDSSPTATIAFQGTVVGTSPSAPRVAAFSSRGPNYRTAEILKPDVIAPGVNILAGWTGYTGPTDLDIDTRRVNFNIISGTSMSCPHVSGLAALLRKANPKWTPAAIKSALMTTAYNVDNTGKSITDLATGEGSTPFVHGAGHVEPNKALDPGLVYDMGVGDYVAFLCAIGYDSKRIAVFVGDPAMVDCGALSLGSPGNLNYPSFSVVFDTNNRVVKYKRVVKNVGSLVDVVYEVQVSAPPPAVEVSVSPSKLAFSRENQTLSYEITFSSVELERVGGATKSAFGSIEWTDGVHLVRSPIAVEWREDSMVTM